MVAKFLDLNNLSWQRRPFTLSNHQRKVWDTVLFLSAMMHRKGIHVNFFHFFCHICRTTVSWGPPEFLLQWQHDIMTSPLYYFAVVTRKTRILKEFRNQNHIIILLYWSVQKENQQKGWSLDKYCVINLQECFIRFNTWGGKFQNLWSTKTDVDLFLLALII